MSAMRVFHSNLELLNEESRFKAQCPACDEGILLVRRDPQSGQVLREDYCILCGQEVIYKDASIAGEMLPIMAKLCDVCGQSADDPKVTKVLFAPERGGFVTVHKKCVRALR